ncbi:7021_t:CDS:2 [Ambispora gerdemannii]|uniref:7021_t:CDS:1 n=1 Tax=Ambispora gerdemannii TaxID=144530 RepID=A0A9N8Z3G5_9GLOM|nr:7021_t:CDS:2 [Ambispora gerdemannii]
MVASSPEMNMLLEPTTNTLFTTTTTNSNSSLLTVPKTPFYGYLLYCEEVRLHFLAVNPTMAVEAMSQFIEEKWMVLTERERQDYSERAKELNWQNLSQDEKNMYQAMITNLQDSNASFGNPKQEILLSREAPELDDTRPLKKSRVSSDGDDENESSDDDADENGDFDYEKTFESTISLSENPIFSNVEFIEPLPSSPFSPSLFNTLEPNTSSIIATTSAADNLATTTPPIMGDIDLFEHQQGQFVAFPKPPSPAFLHFSNYIRPQITAKFPNETYGGINKLIKNHWNSMLKEDREPWEQQAKEDEKRFQKENLCFLATRTLKQVTETFEVFYNQNINEVGITDKENSKQSDKKTNTVTSATSTTNNNAKSTIKTQKTPQKYSPTKLRPILPRPLQPSNNTQKKISTIITTPSATIATPSETIATTSATIATPSATITTPSTIITTPSITITQLPLKSLSIQPHYLLAQHPDLKFGLQVPTRAKSPYQYFYTEFAESFAALYPDTPVDQLLKMKWNRLSPLDREPWESKAKEDHERFRHEKDAYLKNQHKCFINSQNGVSLAEFFMS